MVVVPAVLLLATDDLRVPAVEVLDLLVAVLDTESTEVPVKYHTDITH